MPKIAMPRLVGAAVLALSIAAVVVLPASSLAAPPPGSGVPLVVTPSPASFQKTTVGSQTPSEQFDLLNEGEEEAAIEKIVIEGEDSAAFSLGGSNCGTLLQGQHCQLWIVFQPGSVGEKHATVQVRFSGGRGEESFALSGSAVAPSLSFHPGSYDFGIQPVNSEAQRLNFQVENDGEAGVMVGGPEFGGGSNGFWTGNSDCGGRWLQPGESCSIEVSFGPNNPGAYSTQLRVNAGGQYFSAHLSGEGGRPVVTATPNPADFGAGTVGASGATRTIVLSNSGNVGTGFFIAVVSGGDAGSFHLIEENCTAARLEPFSSCSAKVRFAPLGGGQKTARLSFFGEGDGGMQVALNGDGVPAEATLAPAAVEFGSQQQGTTGPRHVFVVHNDGDTPLDLDGASIVGVSFDQFSLVGDSCAGATLAGGEECRVAVRFSPDGAGAKAATLRIRGDAGTLSASLAGTATDAPVVASRVRFRWGRVSRQLRRGTISTGTALCQAASHCRMTIAPRLRVVTRRQAGPVHNRVVRLPRRRYDFGPNRPRRLEVRLPASVRRLLDSGRGTLVLEVRWSADGKAGRTTYRSAVR
jgi:hypothetical protein